MLFRNCADFARKVLNEYFPHAFHRSIFPDAGVTTPKQITYKLVRYARKHPEIKLTVLEIPQVPGYRWHSHSTKDIAESFSTTAYAVPLTLLNPYLAGGIFVDYLVRGRYHLVPKHPAMIGPGESTALTAPPAPPENAAGADAQARGALPTTCRQHKLTAAVHPGLKESTAAHEKSGPQTPKTIAASTRLSTISHSRPVRQPDDRVRLPGASSALLLGWLVVLSFAAFVLLFKLRLYP